MKKSGGGGLGEIRSLSYHCIERVLKHIKCGARGEVRRGITMIGAFGLLETPPAELRVGVVNGVNRVLLTKH